MGHRALRHPGIHIGVTGRIERKVAQKAGGISLGLGHAVPQRPGQPGKHGGRALMVHLQALPAGCVGQRGAVKKERVGSQAAQIEGLPLGPDGRGSLFRQLFEHFCAKNQMCKIVWHGASVLPGWLVSVP